MRALGSRQAALLVLHNSGAAARPSGGMGLGFVKVPYGSPARRSKRV